MYIGGICTPQTLNRKPSLSMHQDGFGVLGIFRKDGLVLRTLYSLLFVLIRVVGGFVCVVLFASIGVYVFSFGG